VRGIDVAHVDGLLRKRATAKAAKDYAASDAARAELTKLGIEVRDTPDGAEWTIA
jgi:cysteinyl-tRNA synthetase